MSTEVMDMKETTCETPCDPSEKYYFLWGIAYHVTVNDTYYSGNALVRARDAKHAEQVFKTNSAFNGTQGNIVIEAIAQVPTLTESGLCIESYTDGTQRKVNYGA